MDPAASRCTSPDRPATCAPVEPARFVSCDGPHSGTPDDQRPPHWLDLVHSGLVKASTPSTLVSPEATAWAGYGFTAADLAAWVAAGITEPAVAAECRAEGFNPHEPADRAFLGSLADPTDRGSSTWAEVLDMGDDTARTAWAAYKGAP